MSHHERRTSDAIESQRRRSIESPKNVDMPSSNTSPLRVKSHEREALINRNI